MGSLLSRAISLLPKLGFSLSHPCCMRRRGKACPVVLSGLDVCEIFHFDSALMINASSSEMFASQQQVIGMRRGTVRKNLITMKKKLTLDGHQSCQRENERHVLQADWKHWATRNKPSVCDAQGPTVLQRPTAQWEVGHCGLVCLVYSLY